MDINRRQQLSDRDRVILDCIFDPLQPLGIVTQTEVSQMICDEGLDDIEDEGPELCAKAKELLKQAIVLAEQRKFEDALRVFGTLLREAPESASVLNDRAQTLRLAGRDEEALADLDRALELSDGRGRAGVRALCQRGALYRYLERDEKAREDFARAAEAGSNFAKSQLVAMNPYAAMCNAMLQKIGAHSTLSRSHIE